MNYRLRRIRTRINLTLRFFLFLILFHLGYQDLKAQNYGNEWIDYNQSYYKIPINTEGIYRISLSVLQNAGIPASGIDPRNFQLFHKGEEVAIYIEGEGDGVMDPTDFIEFYADGNDGWLDEELYGNIDLIPNPYYSLFNDTAHYYLTWNNSTFNKRRLQETDVNFSLFTPANFVWYNSIGEYHTTYFDGETFIGGLTDPRYVPTEGWLDGPLNLGATKIKQIPTPSIFTSGPNARVEFSIVGASNHAPTTPDHHIRVEFASTAYDTIYEGYKLIRKSFSVPSGSLGSPNTPVRFVSINDLGSAVDRSTVGYVRIRYPRTLNLSGQSSFKFEISNTIGQSKTRLEFSGFNTTSTVHLYDLTNNKRITTSFAGR